MRKRILVGVFCLLTVASGMAAAQGNRRVRIINRSSSAVRYFFASNVERGTWEEDILGIRVLLPNRYFDVNIDDGSGHCLYDLRAVLADGREAVTRRFNVCRESSWTVVEY